MNTVKPPEVLLTTLRLVVSTADNRPASITAAVVSLDDETAIREE